MICPALYLNIYIEQYTPRSQKVIQKKTAFIL
jgi:hypothetical protein